MEKAALRRIQKELKEFKDHKLYWFRNSMDIEQINEKDLFLYKAYIIGP